MKKAVDHQIVRKTNQYLILQTVLAHESVTRAFLSQKLNLSPPSVSHNVENLLARGILIQAGTEPHNGNKLGRKGIVLEFNRSSYYMIGVDLSSTHLRIALSTIYEEMIDLMQLDLLENQEGLFIYQTIVDTIRQLMQEHGLSQSQIGVIVVATPGVINKQTGEMRYAPQILGWENINLKHLLEEEFEIPLVIENDINAIAVGEANYGMGKNSDNFVHLNIDLGVGASIVLRGKVYTGTHFAGGEVGFMTFDAQALDKNSYQNFESLVCIPSIRQRLSHSLQTDAREITTARINQLYAEQNQTVEKEIDGVSRYIALALINITALLNLETIVIGGEITQLTVDLIPKIQQYMQGKIPFLPDIVFSSMGNYSCLRGAFALGATEVINQLVSDK